MIGSRPVTVLALAVWFVAACGDDSSTTPPIGSGSATGTATNVTTGPSETGSGSEDTTGGPSEVCKACWIGACDPEIQTCYADDACACRFECDNDDACQEMCAASPEFDELVECIVYATIGACVDACDVRCEACAIMFCQAEFDACVDDATCQCKFRCNGNSECSSACGESELFDELGACFGAAGNGMCAADCS